MTATNGSPPVDERDCAGQIQPAAVVAIGLYFLLRTREDAGLDGRIKHIELTPGQAGWNWSGESE